MEQEEASPIVSEETAAGWIRRTTADGKLSKASAMSGVDYSLIAAGMALSYNQLGPLIGVSGRQAARYADADFVPEWICREVSRLHDAFLKLARKLARRAEIDAGETPADMPDMSFLACIWFAQRIREHEGLEPARIIFIKND